MTLRTIAVLLYLSVSLFVPCGRSTAQETQDPSPKEITVSPTDDIDAINAKIEKLEEGGTLIFSPGQYHFNKSLVIKNKSITLRGSESAQREDVVLTSDTPKTILIIGTIGKGKIGDENSNCEITIEGLTIRNNYRPERYFVESVRRGVMKPREWLHDTFLSPHSSDDSLWGGAQDDEESDKEPPRYAPKTGCAIKQYCGYLDVISCELSAPQGTAVNVVDIFPLRGHELLLKGIISYFGYAPYVVDTCITDSTICDSLIAVKSPRPLSLRDSIISNNEEGVSLLEKSRGEIDNVQFTGNNVGFSADDSSAAEISSCAFLGNNTAISSRGENCSLQVNRSRFEQNKAVDISCLSGTLYALSCTHSGGAWNAYNCLSPNVFLSDTSIEGYPVGIRCPRHGACRARNVNIKHCKTAIHCFRSQPLMIRESTIADCEEGVHYEIKENAPTLLFGRYERNSFTDTSTPWNVPSGPKTIHRRDNEPNQ
ncbi:MAG: hypothetical protein IKE64_12920 [Thermoguttaceae bacterium]|nr:hypothetical protein [Thermoguttaceae bacterium]